MIKVNYDQNTFLILGYYPDSINYNSIPTPNIEIEDNEQILDKTMCVKDGVYQEFIKPDAELLAQAKLDKITQLNTNRSDYCLEPILYNGNYYATTSNAQIAMLSYILTLGNNETLYPNSEGDNILLNKKDFLEIVSQIQKKEMSSRDFRKSNIDKMNKIELSEKAMEALNNIDITF